MSLLALLADILFVGHSLVGPTLPTLVEAGLLQMGQPGVVQAQIINGAPLRYNWDNSANAEGVDARAVLATGKVDALILTEAIPLAGHVQFNDTAGRIAAFAGLAREANPDVRVYLYETWHSLASGSGVAVPDDPGGGVPWRQRITDDLALWASVAGPGVQIIPAGQAMGLLADEIAAGRVPGITSIRDMFSDDIHPNGKGLYFVALVHLAVLTGKSPEGLPPKLTRAWPSRDAVLTDEQAAVLQRVAWAAVQAFPAQLQAVRPAATQAGGAAEAASAALPAATQGAVVAADPVVVPDPVGPADVAPMPAFAPVTNPNLTLGLAGVNDWSVQQPFLNLMKTARPWTGHLPGQWGGWDHDRLAAAGVLDANGWPRRLPAEIDGLSTLILTDLPAEAAGVAGRYVLTYAGTADVAVEGAVQVVTAMPGRIVFDYAPGTGAVLINVTAIAEADPLRDMVVVREDRAQALADGAVFNPDWLARIRGVSGIRFMDWMATNNSTLARAEDRPRPGDYTWARNGVPMEVMVALANELDADPWFTIPHLAEDALVLELAELAQFGLEPGLQASVEYSNEVWNWQFAQAGWAEEQGKARWGRDQTWVQFYALRAAQVMGIWSNVYGAEAKARLVRVIATQTGAKGLEEQILDAPLVLAEGVDLAGSFDAYAVTGYFSGLLGSEAKVAAVKGWLDESLAAAGGDPARRYDLAVVKAAAELRNGASTGVPEDTLDRLLTDTLPYQARVAAQRGLSLVMYEGGTHVVGYGPVVDDPEVTAFFTYLNFAPEMGALYADLLAGWARVTDAPFNAFVDVYTPNKWGSWGALRHLGDTNPRWEALAKGCDGC
ncbi:MAG: hypothetical protein V4712_04185 [Pseudomonadota bacterium]